LNRRARGAIRRLRFEGEVSSREGREERRRTESGTDECGEEEEVEELFDGGEAPGEWRKG
jgi:hypothetical protein